jgi:hypothetical protein
MLGIIPVKNTIFEKSAGPTDPTKTKPVSVQITRYSGLFNSSFVSDIGGCPLSNIQKNPAWMELPLPTGIYNGNCTQYSYCITVNGYVDGFYERTYVTTENRSLWGGIAIEVQVPDTGNKYEIRAQIITPHLTCYSGCYNPNNFQMKRLMFEERIEPKLNDTNVFLDKMAFQNDKCEYFPCSTAN